MSLDQLGKGLLVLGILLGLLTGGLLYWWNERATPDLASEGGPTQTPPQPSPTPTSGGPTPLGFDRDILPIFQKDCTACHGSMGKLSLESYEDTLNTGTNKPMVISGNPEGSILYQRLLGQGGSVMPPGKALSQAQIQIIHDWILQGAPKTPQILEPTPTPPPTQVTPSPVAAALGFNEDVAPILQRNCTACHGTLGGLSLKSYQDIMTTGTHKPVIVPGNPDGSVLYQRLLGQGGSVMPPGKALPQDQIQIIHDWILQGTKETRPIAGPTPTLQPTPTPAAQATPTTPAATPTSAAPTPTLEPGVVSFRRDVMPIFERSCTACHGALGGLSLKSYQDTMTTGTNKPVIVPGNPEGSVLYQRLLSQGGSIMPPGTALVQAQINIIRDWILQGAKDN